MSTQRTATLGICLLRPRTISGELWSAVVALKRERDQVKGEAYPAVLRQLTSKSVRVGKAKQPGIVSQHFRDQDSHSLANYES